MASPKHLKILRSGVKAWNAWRDTNPRTIPLLAGANLDGLDLREANLRGAHMAGCSLRSALLDGASFEQQMFHDRGAENADLIAADLSDASLKGVRFFHSYLSRTVFRRADLSGAVIEDCALSETIFDGANLMGCDFYSSYMSSASFGDVDLSGAVNLDTILRLPTALLLIEIPKLIVEVNHELASRIAMEPEILRRISPREFEEFIAEIFSRFGYIVELTAPSRDGGKDIVAVRTDHGIASKLLIECKRYTPPNKVDVGLVRQLYTVKRLEHASKALLVTTSYFTRPAREMERQHLYELELKDFDAVMGWVREAFTRYERRIQKNA